MAATTVLVVRHGQSEGNVSNRLSSAAPGTPLTDLGREQAARTGAALADRGVTAVWASPLLRAQQTARLVADAVGVADVATLDGVREFGLGTLEGAESDEAWAELDDVYVRWRDGQLEVGAGGAESASEVVRRVSAALEHVVVTHPGETVVVVSHGGAMELALPLLAGAGPATRSRAVANAAVVELTHEPASGWRLVSWPDLPPLPQDRLARWIGRADAARGAVGGARWERVGGALCSTLPVDQPWATVAAYTAAAEPPDAGQLGQALGWCRRTGRAGYRVVVRGEHLDAVLAATEGALRPELELQVLATEHAPSDPAPEGLQLAGARDVDEFVAVYGEPLRPLVQQAFTAPGNRFVVARDDDRAVGCARLWDVGQSSYVSAVTVLPGERGRGVGTAISAHLTRLGLARHPLTWLTCEAHLVPMYQRLGYERVGTHVQLGPTA
ncbi:GNAT family N-acetyltransferase [Angustibacter aerolatus]